MSPRWKVRDDDSADSAEMSVVAILYLASRARLSYQAARKADAHLCADTSSRLSGAP